MKSWTIFILLLSAVVLRTDCCSSMFGGHHSRAVKRHDGQVNSSTPTTTPSMMMMTSPMPDFSQEEPLFEMLPEPPNEIMIPYEDSMDGTDMDPPIPYEDSMDPIPVTEETASARTRPANEVYAHGVPCVEPYKSDFCLNGGHCLNYSIPSTQYKTVPFHLGCVCVEYFNGLRCEEKGLEGSYGNGMVIRNKRNAKLFQRRAMRGSRKKH